jgi:hypothetical protein
LTQLAIRGSCGQQFCMTRICQNSIAMCTFFDSMSTVGPGENLDLKFYKKILSKI